MCVMVECACIPSAKTHTHVAQVGQVRAGASGESSFHSDVVEFHFDDYQKILYITGTTLR